MLDQKVLGSLMKNHQCLLEGGLGALKLSS